MPLDNSSADWEWIVELSWRLACKADGGSWADVSFEPGDERKMQGNHLMFERSDSFARQFHFYFIFNLLELGGSLVSAVASSHLAEK